MIPSFVYMPVLIFLAQRIILLFLASLTFLGITKEETYFATESSFVIPQERKEAVAELLQNPEATIVFDGTINPPELDIKEIQKTKTVTTSSVVKTAAKDIFTLPGEVIKDLADTKGVTIPESLDEVPLLKKDVIEQNTKKIEDDIEKISTQLERFKKGVIIEDRSIPSVSDPVVASPEPVDPPQVIPDTIDPEPVIDFVSPPPIPEKVTIANTIDNAIVNIVCLERVGNTLSISTGSGVFINNRGTIVTNAHVAQNLLKQNNPNVDCEAKNPNNPTMHYRVAILHIPSAWKNGGLLGVSHGTGEDDFAFLNVVGPAPGGVIPAAFPYISINTNESVLNIGNDILLAAYPGKQTGNLETDTNLPLVKDASLISDIYTFQNISTDVISSNASPVAKQGSSGGAIIDEGFLIGLIATTNPAPGGGNYLNGLTFNYIQRDLQENGLSLSSFL